jgi:probable HAF family extracellular repeat protein
MTRGNLTQAYGINDNGQIVGTFEDASGFHGFVDTGGSFTTVNVPQASDTFAQGINNSSQIMGTFDGLHIFVDTAGNFTTFDPPPGKGVFVRGINDSGQIVGFYQDSSGSAH